MEIFSRVDLSVAPSKRFGISIAGELEENLRFKLEALRPLTEEVSKLLFYTSRRFWASIENEACSIIFNHAVNDFDSLLPLLWNGDGRNAARAARSLYEHLINYCWVAAHDEGRDRYLAHEAVTLDLISKMRRGAMLLKKVAQKRELHRLRRMGRDNRARYNAAREAYGDAFQRDWAGTTLKSRAELCGFDAGYDAYRLLSQVTHGSYGGTLGTQRPVDGKPVHRIGPSLELAALSFLEGLSFFRDLCRRIHAVSDIDTRELVDALNALIAKWPEYREACEWVDKNLWPEAPPGKPLTVMALYPNGGTRWFVWERPLGIISPIDPPTDSKAWEEKIKAQIDFVPDGSFVGDEAGRPITIVVEGVLGVVNAAAKWYPAEAVMLSNEKTQDLGEAFAPL
ncbi:DUF5677 domain-containing protein [Streptomyces sp. NPDC046977]|uniref:DUF5677 domain-containing protein n=1 Tax=Streptomyces sp. NPDC046977 TaxID=3154703 RepID=UPI0033D5C73E